MRMAIWANGSHAAGSGHLVRTGALAVEAQRSGHVVAAFCPDDADGIWQWAWDDVLNVRCLRDFNAFLEQIYCEGFDWIVIDDYSVSDEGIKGLKNGRVLVIDDVPQRQLQSATLILNPSMADVKEEYSHPALLGPEFALIRRPFANIRHHGAIGDILLVAGGTDAAGVKPSCVKVLCDAGYHISVAGVFKEKNGNIKSLGCLSAQDMAIQMAAARALIVTCGSVVWEALTIGVPFIAIEIAENQRLIAEGLRTSGWAPVVNIGDLTSLPQLVERLPSTAISHLDGNGSRRVLDYLERW